MWSVTCQMKDYIQPFERTLAIAELSALANSTPIPIKAGRNALNFMIETNTRPSKLKAQLAYWQALGVGRSEITAQLVGEATSLIARNGVSLNDLPTIVPKIVGDKIPNKRCLRYATHGLHEYRGKFFPQLVRALINMARVPANGVVLDPMCGSGTTLVEAIISGRRAYGLDMNPLSVFVSQVKCSALSMKPLELISAHNQIVERLTKLQKCISAEGHHSQLADGDKDYLYKWFSSQVLIELDQIANAIDGVSRRDLADFFRLCLSNIIRKVSWQKDDDLRVRKEVVPVEPGSTIKNFVAEATRSTKSVVAFLAARPDLAIGKSVTEEGDARYTHSRFNELKGRVDTVITSPPYATALPYLDTDRLSLIYLQLLERDKHRAKDSLMIGNREITERVRREQWEFFSRESSCLPKQTRALIQKIEHLNSNNTVGFRRRNLAALLSKYFFDMRAVLASQHDLLKKSGSMFMVIGNNRTTAGGQEIEIKTTDHLAHIAESVGFRVVNKLPMEMLTSRDIFRKNAMASEYIITLRKAQ